MKPLIVGNWKLNPQTLKEAKQLFDGVKRGVKNTKAEVVICPSFVYITQLSGLSLGAQNTFFEEKGAFTGEVSALQLKDVGIQYVIVGHSERRKYFSETNEIVNRKIKLVLKENIKPIFCVGENEGDDKNAVLEQQITEGLQGISAKDAHAVVIAYEPVWAIGTEKNCSPDETMRSLMLIKKIITGMYNRETADSIKMLYGGSVKSENSSSYVKEAGANGLLVGGASLNAEEFIKIVESVE